MRITRRILEKYIVAILNAIAAFNQNVTQALCVNRFAFSQKS